MKHQNSKGRALFRTRFGAVAATVGSAVGLGNIWRFPYEAGTHGGGAFLVCCLIFTFLLGIPVVCAEFIIGRGARSNAITAFDRLSHGARFWSVAGYLSVIGSILILGFYSVVAGWTAEYFFESLTGQLNLSSQQEFHAHFAEFCEGNWRPALWTLLFLAVNFAVLMRGVAKGIERISNILMPVLFVILLVFCVNSLTLEGASRGLRFLFKPDWSQLNAGTILAALGQSFFSLSLGIGCMITYASYFSDKANLVQNATVTAVLDSLVALLAGVIIFPAVFTFGVSPEAGPTLVFEVLPSIFAQLPGGMLWSILFFFLLTIASLTSTISMSEISIAFLTDHYKMKRTAATCLNTGIALVLGIACALSFGVLSDFTIAGKTLFNLLDYVASNIIMPLGGVLISVFVGWVIQRKYATDQLTNHGTLRSALAPVVLFSLRWIAPVAILLVFLRSIGLL